MISKIAQQFASAMMWDVANTNRISSRAVLATDIVTFAMILPALVLNLLYAYS